MKTIFRLVFCCLSSLVFLGEGFGQVPNDFSLYIVADKIVSIDNTGNCMCRDENGRIEKTISSTDLQILYDYISSSGILNLDSKNQLNIQDGEGSTFMYKANADNKQLSFYGDTDPIYTDLIDRINSITNNQRCILNFKPHGNTDPTSSTFSESCSIRTNNLLKSSSRSNSRDYFSFPTTVGRVINIQDAVELGIVQLNSKGEHLGDIVSMTANYNQSINELPLAIILNIRFSGNQANENNVSQIISDIKRVFRRLKTSNREDIELEIIAEINPNPIYSLNNAYDFTRGFHSISLSSNRERSFVAPFLLAGSNYRIENSLNRVYNTSDSSPLIIASAEDVGYIGHWNVGENEDVYAHETGHLLGIADKYVDLVPLISNNRDYVYVNKRNVSESYTPSEVIDLFEQSCATISVSEEDLRTFNNNVPFEDGQLEPSVPIGNDIMAGCGDNLSQPDIDWIVSHAEDVLIIKVPGGTPFIPKNNKDNFISLGDSQYFAIKRGETVTFNGIFGTIFHKDIVPLPDVGEILDVAPSIYEWNINTPSVNQMREELKNIDKCDLNSYQAFFDLARQDDFPNLVNNSTSDKTGFIVPAAIAPSDPIPTLNQWGLIIFGLLILNLGIFSIRRFQTISPSA